MSSAGTAAPDKQPDTVRHWGDRGTAGVSFAAALAFDDVHVALGGNPVLRGFDLDLVPGEVLCLLGESGSGKSTVLRVAAGLQPVDNGVVRINDRIVANAEATVPPEKRGIGLMFQDFALFPHMTALANVKFGLAGLGRRAAGERAMAALARVGLERRANDYPHAFSGGQQQRLALARSIAARPGILLLDEPFSSLDARLRESVRGETLAVLRETRATSVIVTHDPEEAMLIGDRVALVRDGRVAQVGTPADVHDHPVDLAAARFLAPLSEFGGQVANRMVETPLGVVPAHGCPEGRKVVVAFRPVGDLSVSTSGSGVRGRIVGLRRALGVDHVEIAVAGMPAPVRVRQAAVSDLQLGQDVFVALNPERLLVFDSI